MGENTKIEWADHSWSPWRGCTKVSAGCANCYAERNARRNPNVFGSWGAGAPRVLSLSWSDPMKWNRASLARWDAARGKGIALHLPPRLRVFPSLCDWLDGEVPVEWLARFLALIHDTPDLDWLLLTKRPENWEERSLAVAQLWSGQREHADRFMWLTKWRRDMAAPSNVWFGVSVEDQACANARVPIALRIAAAVRWLSVEPMLGPVDLRQVPWRHGGMAAKGWSGVLPVADEPDDFVHFSQQGAIQWIVIGGESGPRSRWCNVEWIRALAGQCQESGVPVFVKQLGGAPFWNGTMACHSVSSGQKMDLAHPKGGDPMEWPWDLRVREFPKVGLR